MFFLFLLVQSFFYFSPNGKLSKDQIIAAYEQIHSDGKGKDFCKYAFATFGRDNTGTSKNKFKYFYF